MLFIIFVALAAWLGVAVLQTLFYVIPREISKFVEKVDKIKELNEVTYSKYEKDLAKWRKDKQRYESKGLTYYTDQPKPPTRVIEAIQEAEKARNACLRMFGALTLLWPVYPFTVAVRAIKRGSAIAWKHAHNRAVIKYEVKKEFDAAKLREMIEEEQSKVAIEGTIDEEAPKVEEKLVKNPATPNRHWSDDYEIIPRSARIKAYK